MKEIVFTELGDVLTDTLERKKIPLFVDESQDEKVSTFLNFQRGGARVLDAKPMVYDAAKGEDKESVLEKAREALVSSMKHGNQLLIRLSNSAPDFKKRWTDPDYFPIEVFTPGYLAEHDEVVEKTLRSGDRTGGVFAVNPQFHVVVTTTFKAQDAEEFLSPCLPLEHIEFIRVKDALSDRPKTARPEGMKKVKKYGISVDGTSTNDIFKQMYDKLDKLMGISTETSEEYEERLLAYLANIDGGPGASASDESFAKGIGGDKLDHLVEKEYSEMIRGDEGKSTYVEFPIVPCSCTKDMGEHGEDCTGKWVRGMNKQKTCWLYIHTISHEIRSSKPPDYEPPEEEKAMEMKEKDPFADFPSCYIDDLLSTIKAISKDGKTPLVLAEGMYHTDVLAKLKETCEVVDTRTMALGSMKTKIKLPDAMENARKAFVSAMKRGCPAIIDVEDRPPYFEEKVCIAKYKREFPIELFNPKKIDSVKGSMFKQADGDMESTKGFYVAILSSCGPKTYARDLKDYLPWELVEAVRCLQNTES